VFASKITTTSDAIKPSTEHRNEIRKSLGAVENQPLQRRNVFE